MEAITHESGNEDLEEDCAIDPGILMPKTLDSYMTFVRKFANFLNIEGENIPKKYVTDSNMASFMTELGEHNEHKPHFRKSGLAALAYLMRINHLPAWFDFKHLYPCLSNALSVFMLYIVCFLFKLITVVVYLEVERGTKEGTLSREARRRIQQRCHCQDNRT